MCNGNKKRTHTHTKTATHEKKLHIFLIGAFFFFFLMERPLLVKNRSSLRGNEGKFQYLLHTIAYSLRKRMEDFNAQATKENHTPHTKEQILRNSIFHKCGPIFFFHSITLRRQKKKKNVFVFGGDKKNFFLFFICR